MGYKHIIFAGSIPSTLICPYCQEVYLDAKSGPCGHILCTNCWIKNEDQTFDCPICPETQKFEVSNLVNETDTNQVISNLPTCCKYEDCPDHVPLHEREKHIKDCKHSANTKKSIIIPVSNSANVEEEDEEERERRKARRIKSLFIRLCLSLAIYFLFAVFGVVPDPALMRIPFCGVDENGQLVKDVRE